MRSTRLVWQKSRLPSKLARIAGHGKMEPVQRLPRAMTSRREIISDASLFFFLSSSPSSTLHIDLLPREVPRGLVSSYG